MKKFVKLGPPICPGIREITSIHAWAVRPTGIERSGDFVEVSGQHLNTKNLAMDYAYTDDAKFVKKIPIIKGLREAVRKQMDPRGLTWAALGFGYGGIVEPAEGIDKARIDEYDKKIEPVIKVLSSQGQANIGEHAGDMFQLAVAHTPKQTPLERIFQKLIGRKMTGPERVSFGLKSAAKIVKRKLM